MTDKALLVAERVLYRFRYVLIATSILLITLIATVQHASAVCDFEQNCSQNSQCENICFHSPATQNYFDPSCPITYCCKQGPCYLYSSAEACSWYCGNGDIARCDYGAGC